MKDKRAFTFIELIIAVTIFSIVALSIYSTFRGGVRIWQRSNEIIAANQTARIFFDTFSKDIKNAIEYNVEGDFEGGPEKISFMTIIDMYGPGIKTHSELAKVIYKFEVAKENVIKPAKKIVTRKVAGKLEGFDEANANPIEMLDNIEDKDFGFSYCYKGPSEEEPYKWKEAWEDKDKIPRGVKIKLGAFEKMILLPMGELVDEK